jgi:hypothetical protein
MARLSTFIGSNYSGGLNSSVSDRLILDNQVSKVENFDFTSQGQAKVRDGLTKLANILVPEEEEEQTYPTIHGLFEYNDGSTRTLVCFAAGSMYFYTGTGWTEVDDGFTVEQMSVTNNPVDGRMYITSPSNRLSSWKYGEEGVTQEADIKGGKILSFKTYMFVLGNVSIGGSTYKHRIYISAQGGKTFSSDDFIEISGRGAITSANLLGDALIIFKEGSTSFLTGYGLDSWVVSASKNNLANTDESIGLLAPNGHTVVGNEVWFVDDEGQIRRAYQTDFDTFRRDIISANVSSYFDGLSSSQIKKMTMTTFNDKVYVAIPSLTSSNNDRVLVYDILAARGNEDLQSWTFYTGNGWTPKQFCVMEYGSSVEMFFSNNDNHVVKFGGQGDLGEDTTAFIETKRHTFKRPEIFKRFKWGYLAADSLSGAVIDIQAALGGGEFYPITDFNLEGKGSLLDGDDILDSNFYIAEDKEKQIRFEFDTGSLINETDKSIKLKFSYTGKLRPIIYGYSIHFKVRPLT